MKKCIVLLLSLLLLLPATCSAYIPIRAEGRIGPMGVADTFTIDKYQNILGNLKNITHDQMVSGYRFRTLEFEKGSVGLRNDTVTFVDVRSNYGADGTPLGTPRGIVVGHDLKTVLHLYGIPDRIHMYRNLRWYSYSGGDGAALSFGINPMTNKVSEISASVPGC